MNDDIDVDEFVERLNSKKESVRRCLGNYKTNISTTVMTNRIKDNGYKIVYIDDLVNGYYIADVIINHSGGITPNKYSVEKYTKLYLGPKYSLINNNILLLFWSIWKFNLISVLLLLAEHLTTFIWKLASASENPANQWFFKSLFEFNLKRIVSLNSL